MKKLHILFLCVALLAAMPALATQDTLTVTLVAAGGTTPTLSAVSGDTLMIANDGTTWLEIANTGSQITATLISQVSDYTTLPTGAAASNTTVTIPATTGNKIINLTETQSWKDKSSGYTMVILSGTSGITAAAFKLANK